MFLASHLLIGVTIFFPVALTLTYVLSVVLRHVKPVLTFVSYTGNFPPESCLFSVAMNVCSAAYLLIVILRFNQLSDAIMENELANSKAKRMRQCNVSALVFGVLGAAGLSLTGSFQQRVFHFFHVLGAFFCSYGTHVYLWIQTYFSFTLLSKSTSPFIKGFRLALVIAASIIHLLGPILSIYLTITHNKSESYSRLIIVGEYQGRGYPFILGALMEWLLLLIYQIFIASYYPEFKKISLKKDKIISLS